MKGELHGPHLKKTIPEYRDFLVAFLVGQQLEHGRQPHLVNIPRRYWIHIINQRTLPKSTGFRRRRVSDKDMGRRAHSLRLVWAGGTVYLRPKDGMR